jgi:TP901 family phage tail tape measure protein
MAITYDIQFRADTKGVQNQLALLKQDLNKAFELNMSGQIGKELNDAVKAANVLEGALKKATTVNGTSFITMNAELKKAGMSAAQIVTAFSGAQMREATSSFINTFTFANRSAIALTGHIKEMGRVLLQSFKFSAAQDFLRFMSNAIESGLKWAKDMNKIMTDISIVTLGEGLDQTKIYNQILDGAQKLGIAAKEYGEAALIFYQQGLGLEETERRADITVRAAKAARQTTLEMSTQLTAIWNTYQMQGEELERAASVAAKLGADTAVDFKYIAEAMQWAALPAAQLGVEYEQLAAMIATVGETTMQSASTVGNAYKTILARFGNLKAAGEEGQVELGRISEQLSYMGINILDTSGELRDMGNVIDEVGNKWKTYTTKQQMAIANTVGGVRQYGQFIALMENFDKYQTNMQSAVNESLTGSALDDQFNVWADSIEAAANRSREAWAQAFSNLFQEDHIKGFHEAVGTIGVAIGQLLKSFGGLPGILAVAAVVLRNQLLSGTKSLLTTGREILANLTLEGRERHAIAAINAQMAAANKAFYATNSIGLEKELLLTIHKLKATEQITKTVVNLQNLQRLGNAQQQQEATTQLQILTTMQQRLFTALDEQHTNAQELRILQNLESTSHNLSIEEEAQLKTSIAKLKIQQALVDGKAEEARLAFDEASTDAEKLANEQEAGLDGLSGGFMNVAMGVMTATMALNQFTSMLNGETEVSLGSVLGLLMTMGMAMMTLIPGIKAVQVGLTALKTRFLTTGISAVTASGMMGISFTSAGVAITAAGVTSSIAWLPFTLIALAIVAALTLVVGAVIAVTTAIKNSSPEKKFADAQAAAKALRDELNDAKEAADAFRESIDKFKETRKTLDSLVEGTEEWKEALKEANQQAIEMLNAYPQLAKYVERVNGQITFQEGSEKAVQKELDDAVAQATLASTLANQSMRDAQNNLRQNTLNKQIGKEESVRGEHIGGAAVGAATGALYGAGTGIGAIPGAIVGVITGIIAGEENRDSKAGEALESVLEKFSGEMESSVDAAGNTFKGDLEIYKDALINQYQMSEAQAQAYVDQLQQNYSSTMELKNAIDANTEIRKIENEQAASEILGDDVMKSEAANEITAVAGRMLGDLTKDLTEQYRKDAASRGAFNSGSSAAKDTWDLYAAEMGLDAKVTNYKGNGNIEFEQTVDGEVVKTEVTANQIASILAAAEAQKQLVSATADLVAKYDELARSAETSDQAILSFLGSGNMMNASAEEFEGLKDAIADAGGELEYLNAEFGGADGVLDDTEAYALSGYDSAQAWADALKEGVDEAQIGWDEVDLSGWNITGTEELGLNASKKLQEMLESASQGAMAEGGEKMAEFFNKIMSGQTEEDAGKILSALTDIDWSSWDATDQAINTLDRLGLNIDMTKEEWEEMAAAMREANNASPIETMQNLVNTMSQLHEITSELEFGDVISEEDYNRLIAYDATLKDMFMAMADGSYKLISDGDLLKNLNVDEAITGLQRASELYNSMNAANWGHVNDQGVRVKTDWDDYASGGGDQLGTLKNLQKSSDFMEIAEIIGYDKDEVAKVITDLENQIAKGGESVTDESKKLFGAFAGFMNDASLADVGPKVAEMRASMATSLRELTDMLNAESITDEAYQKAWQGLVGSINQVKEAIEDFSAANFSGDIREQTDALELLNARLMMLGLSQLSAEFLALSEAEQESIMSLKQLQMAQNDYNGMIEKFGANSVEAMAAYSNLLEQTANTFDLDATDLSQYAQHLRNVAEESDNLDNNLKNNQRAALAVATAVMRMDKGVEALADGFEEWNDILTKNTTKTAPEYSKAINGMRKALSDLLNVSEDFVSNDFIEKNLKDIELAATGSEDAIDRLKLALGQDIAFNAAKENIGGNLNELRKEIYGLHDAFVDVANNLPEFKVGAELDVSLDDGQFIGAANDLVQGAKMTVDQAQAYFNSLGYEPEFEMVEQDVTSKKPITRTETRNVKWIPARYDADGNMQDPPDLVQDTVSYITGYEDITEKVMVPYIGADGPVVKSLTYTGGGSMNSYSSSNPGGGPPGKGGGGSEPKKVTAKQYGERYRDTTDALQEVTRNLEKVSTAEDKAFGLNKLRLIQVKNTLLQEQAKHYQKLAKEAEAYLNGGDGTNATAGRRPVEFGEGRYIVGNSDKGVLQTMLQELGIAEATFDSDNFVSNAEQIKNALNQLAIAATGSADGIAELSEEEQKAYEAKIALYDAVESQIDLINEGAIQLKEASDKQLEIIHDWLSLKIAETDLKMELRLRVNASDVRQLEFLLNRLGDRASAISLDNMIKGIALTTERGKALIDNVERLKEITGNINNIDGLKTGDHQNWFKQEFGSEAWDEFLANGGAFTQEMLDNLADKASQIMDTIEELHDKSAEIFAMYRQAAEVFLRDFDRLLSIYDDHTTMLDSWKELWMLAGTPWKNQRMELDLMSKSISNQTSKIKGLREEQEFLEHATMEAQRVYEAAVAAHGPLFNGDPEDMTQNQKIVQDAYESWKELESQAHSTQATVMSETAAMANMFEELATRAAEVIRSEFQAALNGMYADFEGLSAMFEQKKTMDTFFEHIEDAGLRLGKLMEETIANPELLKDAAGWERYLGDMLEKRVVQTEILGEMREHEVWVTKEGVQLTDKQLSIIEEQFELEKQKAAFEEQQQMKNTMRLARDSSGNWSYVYSNDQDPEEDKAQAIEDRLANIRKMHREAVDELTDFWVQQMLEWEEFEANVDQRRYEQDEKYRAQVDAQRAWYEEMLGTLASQVNIHLDAIDTDFTDTTLSTILNLDRMDLANIMYTNSIRDMSLAFRQNWQENQEKMHQELETMGIDMDNFEDTVKEETDKIIEHNKDNEDSIEELNRTGQQELSAMTTKIIDWSTTWQSEIAELIRALQELLDWIRRVQKEQSGGGYFDATQDYAGNLTSGNYTTGSASTEAAARYWKQKAIENYMNTGNMSAWTEAGGTPESMKRHVGWYEEGIISGLSGKSLEDYIEQHAKQYGFDTGGIVTGPMIAGLAMDGKKELVLNADDTKNILNAVDIMRLGVAQHLASLSNARTGTIAALNTLSDSPTDSQPQVVIQADFPNVTAREEIEAAFSNLVNQAAQYTLKPKV